MHPARLAAVLGLVALLAACTSSRDVASLNSTELGSLSTTYDILASSATHEIVGSTTKADSKDKAKDKDKDKAPQARKRASDAEIAAALISQHRRAHGLGPVKVDPHLNAPALHQAQVVAQTGWLFHGEFASRMASYGIRGQAAENLSAGLWTVEQVIAQWKASPGHNSNLLLPAITRIGLARVDRPGSTHGRYWALVLAR
jgi:uncharacterized protein YkwD